MSDLARRKREYDEASAGYSVLDLQQRSVAYIAALEAEAAEARTEAEALTDVYRRAIGRDDATPLEAMMHVQNLVNNLRSELASSQAEVERLRDALLQVKKLTYYKVISDKTDAVALAYGAFTIARAALEGEG
jgi:hypothetical protein